MHTVKVLAAMLVVGLSFVLGLKIGVHVGVAQFVQQEGSVKAALVAGELRAMRAGNTEKLISGKEIELDGEIVKALAFRESGHPWLFWPFEGAYKHTRYLKAAAAYRSQYPAAVPELQIGEENPFAREMKSYAQVVRERTSELLRDYGD